MAALHLVIRPAGLPPCLETAGPDDAILLLEDGVYAATVALAPERALHVLEPDVAARGLVERLSPRVTLVDDPGFVALVESHQPVVTWR